jgi:predicted enzyme related to lactoylglutathione lyase
LTGVVIRADDVDQMVDFWLTAFESWYRRPDRGEVRFVPYEEHDGGVDVVITSGRRRPKNGKNRIHLDLASHHGLARYESDKECYEYFGARAVDIGQGELVPWTVYTDPEGNEFCLLKPRDRDKDTGVISAIVVDCADPPRLAEFWSAATGWDVVEREPDFAALRVPGELPYGPYLEFSRIADVNPEPSPVMLSFESYWPHQHDRDVAALEASGARRVRRHDGGDGGVSYTIVADPEGNEFRVVVPVWPPRAP